MIFGNKTLGAHVLRGVFGFAALACALATANNSIWPSLLLMPFALWMLKGCPVCWTIGLIETARDRWRRNMGQP
jgi:tryptophan-rich sensory protein